MEIDPDYLPAGVHVIASVEAYGEEHPPRESGRNTTVLVSASGQLAIYHPNHVAEAVIEIGNISELESLELVSRKVIKKKLLMFWKLCMIYSIIIWLAWIIGTNIVIIDQIQNGYVTTSSSDVSEGVDTNVLYEGIIVALFGIFIAFTLLSPWGFAYVGERYVPQYVRQRHLILLFKDGSEYSIFEGPEWSGQYRLLGRLLKVFIVSLIIMMIPSSEFIILLVSLVIGGIVGAFLGLAASYVNKDTLIGQWDRVYNFKNSPDVFDSSTNYTFNDNSVLIRSQNDTLEYNYKIKLDSIFFYFKGSSNSFSSNKLVYSDSLKTLIFKNVFINDIYQDQYFKKRK